MSKLVMSLFCKIHRSLVTDRPPVPWASSEKGVLLYRDRLCRRLHSRRVNCEKGMLLYRDRLCRQINCAPKRRSIVSPSRCPSSAGGGRMERWCWVNFQWRGVLLVSVRVGQGPTALAVGAGGGCLDIFSLICHFSLLSPSWETARYILKYCLKGPQSPKQPTNQPSSATL